MPHPLAAMVAPESIIVDRDARQRQKIDITDLRDTIRRNGVIVPLIVTRDMRLIAGERRLTTALELKLAQIPVRFLEDLPPEEAQIIELEENLKRQDLPWQDTARAIDRLHKLYLSADPSWSITRTGAALSLSQPTVTKYLRVARELHDPKINLLPSVNTAANILARRDERSQADALSKLVHEVSQAEDTQAPATRAAPAISVGESRSAATNDDDPGELLPFTPPEALPEIPILNEDFLTWAPTWRGAPFNLIHCDFPYGIEAFSGSQVSQSDSYDDQLITYITLIKALGEHSSNLIAHSAHIMFWFSMEHYQLTLELLDQHLPDFVFQRFPLIWHKSDNSGVLPDPKRGPRRVYESCLIGSREDRLIIRAVSNTHSSPPDRKLHPSAKPEPMLRHFMSMFVDNGTRMLDPTCGSASSLRAATTLGAQSVLGLERDPEFHANATKAYKSFLTLRSL